MTQHLIIIENNAYRLREDGLLETAKVSLLPADFAQSSAKDRNMQPDQDALIAEHLKIMSFQFPNGRSPVNRHEPSMTPKKEQKKPKQRQFGAGVLNEYTCVTCRKSVVVIDKAEGIVEPTLPCMGTLHCRGYMVPDAYTGKERPTYAFRPPTDEEIRNTPGMDKYFKDGGMVLQKIGSA